MSDPRIVIVGGGVGGVATAQQLAKLNFSHVTVIDRRNYFEIPWPNVRIPVDPALITKTTLPLQEVPKIGKVVHGRAASISASEVHLEDGSSVPFDFLVLANGSTWTDPVCSGTEPLLKDRKLHQAQHSQELKAANTVLIIGVGAVGVELAAEVAETYPSKKVMLVQSNKQLVPGYSPRMSRQILKILQRLKVEVLLSERANEAGSKQYQLSSGRIIAADKVYICVGGKPNTAFLKSSTTSAILDSRGYVKVNDFLQVEGHPSWFALGDITSLSDYRLGRLASDQGALVAAQIKALHARKESTLKAWKKHNGLDLIAVSLGRKNGAMSVFGWGFSGWAPFSLNHKT